MSEQDCGCEPQEESGPITSEDAVALAFDALQDAREEALAGRATEAAMLNQTAQLALQMVNALEPPLLNPLATGTIQ